MKRTIISIAALSFLLTGYKTQPDKEDFVNEISEVTMNDIRIRNQEMNRMQRLMREVDDFQPKDFIESCIDGSIVVKSFGVFDVAKLPNGEGLGTVALGAFGKVWTYGEKVNDQVIPMLAAAFEDLLNKAGK